MLYYEYVTVKINLTTIFENATIVARLDKVVDNSQTTQRRVSIEITTKPFFKYLNPPEHWIRPRTGEVT